MSTIIEALQFADTNLGSVNGAHNILPLFLAKHQLHIGLILLKKGYDINDEIEPLLTKYGDVDGIPVKDLNIK